MRDFLRNRRVQAGLGIFAAIVLGAFIGPAILSALGRHADDIDYAHLGTAPSSGHLLGTTLGGMDVLNQLLYGARDSVICGFLVALFTTVISVVVGLASAYLGGAVDITLNGFTNVALTMSGFPLLVVIASFVPDVGVLAVALVISIVSWAGSARTIRAQTLSLRKREFIVAMKMVGERRSRLMFVEVLPHLVPVISAQALGAFIVGVVSQAGLAVFGLGGGRVNWGTMISDVISQGAISQGMWWWFIPPGLAIVLVGLALTLINFGVDEISNPRLRGLDPRAMRQARRIAKRAQERVTSSAGTSEGRP